MIERGREQPPDFTGCPVPRTAPGVAHAPMSVSRSVATILAISAPITRVCHVVYAPVISRGSRRSFSARSPIVTRPFRPSHRQCRAVLGAVKARRCAPTARGPAGLDDACAQLESSPHVMAEEGPRVSNTNPLTKNRDGAIVEISSAAAQRSPSASPDAEHTNRRRQVTVRSLLSNTLPG